MKKKNITNHIKSLLIPAGNCLNLKLEPLEFRLLLSVSADEQLCVYLLNRARSDPQAYEIDAELTESLAAVEARPPLAINESLFDSAEFHAVEMAANDYFGHQSAVTGDWPNKMALDAGYNLPYSPTSNQIESIAAGVGNVAPNTAAKVLKLLIEDIGVPSLGHRLHLMGQGGWQQHREIGVGYDTTSSSTYSDYWSIHTAYANTTDLFLTGVIYNDTNGNQLYDKNEGLSGVTVSTDQGGFTTTNVHGGWSIPVAPGGYFVTAAGGGFSGTGMSSVIVADANIEVDFISGDAGGIVNFGLGDGSGRPTVTVTAADADAAEKNLNPGTFIITRSGATDTALTVNYTLGGSADNGQDYDLLGSSVEIPIGSSSTAVTITPIDDDQIEGQETVTLSVDVDINYLPGAATSATVMIADDEGLRLNFDQTVSTITFTDADNTAGAIKVKSASGTVIFTGEGLASVLNGNTIAVHGGIGAEIDRITLDNSGPATSLAFTASGGADGRINVNTIVINGSAQDIKGTLINLTGDITVTGGLKKLELGDIADQHLIDIGPADLPADTLSLKFLNVTDLSLNSEMPIKTLAFNHWEDNDATADMINAPSVGKIVGKADFAAGMNLTDNTVALTLAGVSVKGSITGGAWTINGNVGKVAAGNIAEDWSANITGDLAGLTAKGDAGGDLTARSLKAISVAGNYTDAEVNLTLPVDPINPKLYALGKLTAKGTMEDVNIRSAGNIGKITLGVIKDSNIFAGINNSVTALPVSPNDYDAQAAIAGVKIKGVAGGAFWFENSNIAASDVGAVAFGFAQTDNGDDKFGIAAGGFKSIAYKDAAHSIKISHPNDVAAFNTLDDLLVRIL